MAKAKVIFKSSLGFEKLRGTEIGRWLLEQDVQIGEAKSLKDYEDECSLHPSKRFSEEYFKIGPLDK